MISEKAKQYHEQMFPNTVSKLMETDPEFVELFDNFAFDEVISQDDLDGHLKFMSVLAMLLGCQGIDEFKVMLPVALRFKVTPVEMKEIVYQAVAYLGIGRGYPFLHAVNDFFEEQGIVNPLPPQATTTSKNRLEKGIEAQIANFGESMRGFDQSGPQDTQHIHTWLCDNCFGDYYTRNGLTYAQRELMTFCYLAAQGGCEPELKSHSIANLRLGNSKELLISIVSHNIPFIGYPRSLHAIRCIEEAQIEFEGRN